MNSSQHGMCILMWEKDVSFIYFVKWNIENQTYGLNLLVAP